MKMIEKLRQHENEIRELRMNGMKMKDLAEKYGVTYSTMTHFLTTHRIVLNAQEIDNNKIEYIINKYLEGVRYDYIAKEMHMDKEAIKNIILQSGNKIREKSDAFQQYHINQNYFDNIDSPEKAYILGLLYTDGNRNKRNNHYQIVLKLQDTDVDILYKIKDCLEYDRPLKFSEESKKHPNIKDQYSLIIDNKQIATSLERWGIIPNKTKTLSFPTFLSDELIPHFIRGCWDGDGTISHNLKEQKASFIGTYDMCMGIKNYIENKLDIHFSFKNVPSLSMDNLCTIGVSGGRQLKKFLDFIYKDSTIHFNRKYSYYRYMCYREKLDNSLSA